MRWMELGGAAPAAAAREFADALGERWGVGHAACADGVVLLLATEDRQVYISTARGAHLSPERIDQILQLMKPKLRAEDWGGALEQARGEGQGWANRLL